jgi:transposase
MRGRSDQGDALFSFVGLEERVPADHPLRAIRALTDEVLVSLSGRLGALYARTGRPSIPPEMLLRATLLQAFFSIRSERLLMEQINYNLLFRWFVGLSMDADVWHPTGFTHNRDRLLEADVARDFLAGLMSLPKVKRLMSSEHFSVDGTLIDAWASMKSFRPRDGSGDPPQLGRNGERDFHGEKRSNETHASTTDPDARLYRKANGRESRLCYMGHAMMENRNGLVVDAELTLAIGLAEREATLAMLDRRRAKGRRITLAADKAYDVQAFVGELRARKVTPHIAVNGSVSKTGKVAKPRSTSAPPIIPATPSAYAAASASRRCSAGSRRRPGSRRSKSEADRKSSPSSDSLSPPTIL